MSILIYKQRHRHPNYKKTPKGNYAHIGYIATRPGAVKNEGMRHGLFGKLEPGVVKEFDTWQAFLSSGQYVSWYYLFFT